MLNWDEKYETGIKSIDDQHKELIRMTGELSDLLTNAHEGDDIYDDMAEIIARLKDYTVYHFNYEEKLFDRFNYEFKDSHIKEHNDLVKQIESLDLRAVDEDQISYGKKILKFLITWVFKHISGSDFLYRATFLQNGVC